MSEYGRFEHSNDVVNKSIVLRDIKNTVYKIIWEIDKNADLYFKKYTNPKLEKLNKSSFKYFCSNHIIIDIPSDLSKKENVNIIINMLYHIRCYFTSIDENSEVVEGRIPVYTSKYYYKDKPVVIINYLEQDLLFDYMFVRKYLSFEIDDNIMNNCNKHFLRQLNFIDCEFSKFHSDSKSKFIYSGNFANDNNDYNIKTSLSTTFINIDVLVGRNNNRNEFENVYGLIMNSIICNSKLSDFFARIDKLRIIDSEFSYVSDEDLVYTEDYIPVIEIVNSNDKSFKHYLNLENSKLFINNKFRYTDEDFERDDMICNEECGSIFIDIKEPLKLVNQYVTLDLNVIPYTTKTITKSAVKKIEKVGRIKI